MTELTTVLAWPRRRWLTVVVGSIITAALLGLPTDVIPNPVFGRQGTPVTWWSYLALAITSLLSGFLLATYVNQAPRDSTGTATVSDVDDPDAAVDPPGRLGSIGALLTFFAIGCPICNKVVVIALGAAGATRWFAPVQPYLAAVSIALLVWALRSRLRGELACPVSRPEPSR